MIVGYARTSTVEQRAGFEAQRRELEAAKCEKIFEEQVSSIAERRELNNVLDFGREGEVLVVTKMDRLAQSVLNFMEIANALERKNVKLQILNMGIDTRTPTGRSMLSLLRGITQLEREIMLERQREGIAKAKSEGKYKGRKALADVIAENVVKLDRRNRSRRHRKATRDRDSVGLSDRRQTAAGGSIVCGSPRSKAGSVW